MLSAYRSQIEKELRLLRSSKDDRAFQFGYVSGLLSAYLSADAISFTDFQRLTALKISAWNYAQSHPIQPGQPAQTPR